MKSASPRPMRIRYSNRLRCFLCYLIAFVLPLLWEAFALVRLYPRKLAYAAPDVTALWNLPVPDSLTLQETLQLKEAAWLGTLAVCALSAWLITLLVQLLWRVSHAGAIRLQRGTGRAVRHYRMAMLFICLVNLAVALGLWHIGLRHVPGRTLWDWIITFGIYPLLPISAFIVSRLAAPAVLSGRGAFFKRI